MPQAHGAFVCCAGTFLFGVGIMRTRVSLSKSWSLQSVACATGDMIAPSNPIYPLLANVVYYEHDVHPTKIRSRLIGTQMRGTTLSDIIRRLFRFPYQNRISLDLTHIYLTCRKHS